MQPKSDINLILLALIMFCVLLATVAGFGHWGARGLGQLAVHEPNAAHQAENQLLQAVKAEMAGQPMAPDVKITGK
jgi:hypothetical protein